MKLKVHSTNKEAMTKETTVTVVRNRIFLDDVNGSSARWPKYTYPPQDLVRAFHYKDTMPVHFHVTYPEQRCATPRLNARKYDRGDYFEQDNLILYSCFGFKGPPRGDLPPPMPSERTRTPDLDEEAEAERMLPLPPPVYFTLDFDALSTGMTWIPRRVEWLRCAAPLPDPAYGVVRGLVEDCVRERERESGELGRLREAGFTTHHEYDILAAQDRVWKVQGNAAVGDKVVRILVRVWMAKDGIKVKKPGIV
ncbi:hypothetical protein M501DRAFT_1033057 [Patellaria atrata CBS 101060]|uniref:Uncharacterized protein n=1 Tax=Patellaria atrata CBS 101060 TaxID=1346257 RepID=A0A9P4VLB8_9PEZI|nr:hypothetical protein M501DRAFT_1033057 [Patellaria atrata CBS 101060]